MPLLLADQAALTSPIPLVTAAEAHVLALPVRSRSFQRVRRGVYADRVAWQALPPWQRYQARVHAFLLTRPDAILCLESAAVVWGLPLFGEPRDIHIYAPGRGTSTRSGDIVVHTHRDEREVVAVGGIRVTSQRDTVVDLARVLPPAHAVAVADAALSPVRGGALARDELRARAAEQVDSRGIRQCTWIWDHADGRAESTGESISRCVIAWCGFELPELQREFAYEGSLDRVDFFFPSVGAIGESDGWGKYELPDPAAAARNLREEKRREDRLRRHGHPFGRWDQRDAMRVDPLARVLTAMRVPLVAAPQHAFLDTLRRDPRRR